MAATALATHVQKMADSYGKAYQLLKAVLGSGSAANMSAGTTVSGVVERDMVRVFTPEDGTYGTASLSAEIDLKAFTAALGEALTGQTRKHVQDIAEWSASGLSDHKAAEFYKPLIVAMDKLLKGGVQGVIPATKTIYTWESLMAGSAWANRLWLSPEFALLARCAGIQIQGSAVRAPTTWGSATEAVQITTPSALAATANDMISGTGTGLFTESAISTNLGAGVDGLWVGHTLQIVNKSGGAISLGTNDASISIHYKDELGASQTLTLNLGQASWANDAAKDFAAPTAVTALISDWRLGTNLEFGTITPGNAGNATALSNKRLNLQFKDVTLTA